MGVVSELVADVKVPKMVKVRQKFDVSAISKDEIKSVIAQKMERDEIRGKIKPGMRIAITCGSRGVANIALIIKSVVDFVKECQAIPFVFPAMGSHGGATVEGQLEIVHGYGVTEEYLGCEICATMETVQIGETQEGMPVFIDKYAAQADGIILVGRIKPHTAFRGPFESGLMKMAVIGMGKQHGAETCHESGFKNMGRIMPMIGREILKKTNIVAGVGIIENAFDETCKIEVLTKEEIPEKEPALLVEAKEKMGHILFDTADVLVVDQIGKDCSGDGMDPNVTGTYGSPYGDDSKGFRAQRLVVLDFTESTHGNGNGIGVADVTTKRLVDKYDTEKSYPNAITSTVLVMVKIPMYMKTDKEAVQVAIKSCNEIDKENPRIVRIKDTMHLEEIYISEAMIEEAKKNPAIEIIGEPEDWGFDENGNLW